MCDNEKGCHPDIPTLPVTQGSRPLNVWERQGGHRKGEPREPGENRVPEPPRGSVRQGHRESHHPGVNHTLWAKNKVQTASLHPILTLLLASLVNSHLFLKPSSKDPTSENRVSPCISQAVAALRAALHHSSGSCTHVCPPSVFLLRTKPGPEQVLMNICLKSNGSCQDKPHIQPV